MKKAILVCLLYLWVTLAGSPLPNVITIEKAYPIRPYNRIAEAVAWVESSNNPKAYNKKEGAVGLYQVREIRLKDYEQQTGIHYDIKEMYDPIKSKSVFLHYATKYHYNDIESISRCWNGGERGMKKRSTKEYYQKVKKIIK